MRYERKYILTSEEAVALENVIRLHPCGLSHHYPTRQVNNIYFDSLQGNYNSQNLDGINIRQKCRWRWYGERLQSDVQIFQEIKSKHNLLGEKSKTLISLKNTNQQNFISIANELLLENNLFAVLYNSYCRQYWQSFDMKISLTTDTDMLFGNPKTGWLNLQTTILPQVVLEVKYDETEEDYIDEFLQALPFRMSKNSKFVTGLTIVNN